MKQQERLILQERNPEQISHTKRCHGRIPIHMDLTVVGDRQVLSDSYWDRYITETRNNWKKVDANVCDIKLVLVAIVSIMVQDLSLEAFDRTTGTKEIIATGYRI